MQGETAIFTRGLNMFKTFPARDIHTVRRTIWTVAKFEFLNLHLRRQQYPCYHVQNLLSTLKNRPHK